jgi:FtsP/CotA-like multicopper oxidase with cupredoxin domain
MFRRKVMRTRRILIAAVSACTLAFGVFVVSSRADKNITTPGGRTRIYYIAADQVVWNYAPAGKDQMMGMPFEGLSKLFAEPGPHRLGSVVHKAMFREYTDDSFKTLKPRGPNWEHLGILGPLIRAEVGDTIKIVFRNNVTFPVSMHPHGVFYDKASEGSPYNDGNPQSQNLAVQPGGTKPYIWQVPHRAGPAPGEPSSKVWLYHSHVDEYNDINTGLVGAMIITARGKARPDASPTDVDREFVTMFVIFDESRSWYLDKNIQDYAQDPKSLNKGDVDFILPDDTASIIGLGRGFANTNHKYSINGFIYANGPMLTMKKGEHVRWYLINLGDGFNFHTPHWHGNTVTVHGERTDVVALSPAQMLVADMVPDDPGVWLFHCHVSDHMAGGMVTRYEVLP